MKISYFDIESSDFSCMVIDLHGVSTDPIYPLLPLNKDTDPGVMKRLNDVAQSVHWPLNSDVNHLDFNNTNDPGVFVSVMKVRSGTTGPYKLSFNHFGEK